MYKFLSSKVLFKNKYLSVLKEELARVSFSKKSKKVGGEIVKFYHFDFSDWVHVLAVDKNENIVIVKQWRFGEGNFTLELPGGSMKKGEKNPLLAAKRELKEETG